MSDHSRAIVEGGGVQLDLIDYSSYRDGAVDQLLLRAGIPAHYASDTIGGIDELVVILDDLRVQIDTTMRELIHRRDLHRDKEES